MYQDDFFSNPAVMGEFFAPTSSDAIDGLIANYLAEKKRIEEVAVFVASEFGGVIHYYLDGNDSDRRYGTTVERLFCKDGAINALNASFWSRALSLTDVYDCMPQKRRDEWNTQLTEWKKPGYRRGNNPAHDLPDFEDHNVRDTLQSLLASRNRFFAERVDGIYRSLSGEHLTNSPMGFGKRMIVGCVLNEWWGVNHSRVGYINDLRAVVAKFMGRDEPKWNATSSVVDGAKRDWGQWHSIDGGAIRIRVYKKGTAHIEIHPDMAWKLNAVLASIYPNVIPAEFRVKPKKRSKEFQMMQRPLPFAVLECLSDAKGKGNIITFGYYAKSNPMAGAYAEAEKVLRSIGGVKIGLSEFEFDYNPSSVLSEILSSGCIPDQKSHQFYPTPSEVAAHALEIAEIGETDTCLEPSAGQGGIADLLPKDRTVCVEISALHCGILREKGHTVVNDDFLAWAKTADQFERIIMNPPFSEGRAMAHVEAALSCVKSGGRLVAIMPASFRNKSVSAAGEWSFTWSAPIENAFAGTSISVVILCAKKA